MKLFSRSLTLTSIVCVVCGLGVGGAARATVRAAPGPEIGDGVIGVAVAVAVLLAVVMLPRITRLLRSKAA
jgi:ACR3 family arsenite efflux pump ArsB